MNKYLSSMVILGMMSIFSCKDRQKTTPESIRPVTVEWVKKWNRISRYYTGGVEAEIYANLAFPFSGPLIELPVELGEQLPKGSLIAIIDPLNSQADYDSKRAAYMTAKSQWERNVRLLKRQAISQQTYELSKSEYLQANAAYEISENRLAETELRAPFDGIVTQKYVENYQRVESGEPIIRLMDPKRIQVVFLLPEMEVELLEKEWQIAVAFDHDPEHWFTATLREVVGASLDGSGIPVCLSITDSLFQQGKYTVLPGFSCQIRIEIEEQGIHGYALPLSAILKNGQNDSLWVWKYDTVSSRVKRQLVIADGLIGRSDVRILSGLNSDDQIVVSGGHALIEGEKVKVITH